MDNTPTPPNNFLNWVEIKNFKSIKDLRLDCKRVNVFIGKPNVGKSNILEALGLLGTEYVEKFFEGSLRYEKLSHLFYDNDIDETIFVRSDKVETQLSSNEGYDMNDFDAIPLRGQLPVKKKSMILLQTKYSWIRKEVTNILFKNTSEEPVEASLFNENGILLDTNSPLTPAYFIYKYDFANLTRFVHNYQKFLLPPNGPNLYAVIRRNKKLSSEFTKLFSEQDLELVFYDENYELILQKKEGSIAYQYPFFSIADTFRRYMFYITAIESNTNSVIIFEEPEVHSFPPYTKALAHRMAGSETNQFFIATHSPYLLNTLIDELDDADLSVFITYYRDYQTHVRALTADELREARDLGIDLFYNLSRYEPNA